MFLVKILLKLLVVLSFFLACVCFYKYNLEVNLK